MPTTSLVARLGPIAQIARQRGLVFERLDNLVIVMDRTGRFLGVALWAERDFIVSTVFDRKTTTRLTARWIGPLPKPGHYLKGGTRAFTAYKIVAAPTRLPHRTESRLGLRVEQVRLPLPEDAVVHRWRWIHGSRFGEVVR